MDVILHALLLCLGHHSINLLCLVFIHMIFLPNSLQNHIQVGPLKQDIIEPHISDRKQTHRETVKIIYPLV